MLCGKKIHALTALDPGRKQKHLHVQKQDWSVEIAVNVITMKREALLPWGTLGRMQPALPPRPVPDAVPHPAAHWDIAGLRQLVLLPKHVPDAVQLAEVLWATTMWTASVPAAERRIPERPM